MPLRTLLAIASFLALCLSPLSAQPRAILVDGPGPWRDSPWTFAVSQFTALLTDAGYSVQTTSPVDLPSVVRNPDVLLAVPSLETLPIDAFKAIAAHVAAGGGLMATGGEPFRVPLYLAPDGQWLTSAAWLQTFGTSPPQGSLPPPLIPTVSPANKEQFTAASGLHVPIVRGRGLFATTSIAGRCRVIGDLLSPAATVYVTNAFSRSFVVWLPWPQLFDPLRAQLVEALQAVRNRVAFNTVGADQLVWLPGESVSGKATVLNYGSAPVQATLRWSVSGPSGVTAQPDIAFSLAPGQIRVLPLDIGTLPNGNYTLTFHLMLGDQEADRADSPVRVLDPTLSRQPAQKIRVVDGAFTVDGRHIFLRGVNYWPRYIPGVIPALFNGQSWLQVSQYDPDLIEADLAEIAALGFNLLNIQYGDYSLRWAEEGRSLVDFLERCRNHGIWVQISLRTTLLNGAYQGQANVTLDQFLQAAFLAGNDRVFAYDLLWEPMLGFHDHAGQGRITDGVVVYNVGRLVLDPDWRAWVNDQYGSLSAAEQIWGFATPRDAQGQLTNPLDTQIDNDGPWRVMVAAYRRFLEDYLGRNLGAIARHIRRTDPDTLLTYRNWITMTPAHNSQTGYDIGTAAAHLDFVSPERYGPAVVWPDNRDSGLVTAYSRYRAGAKPVVWAEFGADVGRNYGAPSSRAAQGTACDAMMRQVAEDGSNGASVWWWPGGYAPLDGSDFGIVDPDGSPRPCANVLAQWNRTFASIAPDLTSDPPTTITVDRDADARGSYGLFLNYRDRYVQERQAGHSVVLTDHGAGSDTSTMPLVQVGNAPYTGTGPLKFANAEFAGIRVVCPGVDVIVENGSSLAAPPGAVCQVTPTLVNTGEARWLPTSVVLHTTAGDIPLAAPVPTLQRTPIGPLSVAVAQNATTLTGRLRAAGAGEFGEVLNLTFTGPAAGCAIALDSTGTITSPAAGVSGSVNVTTPFGCRWSTVYSAPWLTVTPDSASGSVPVTYSIAANYGPARWTTLEIAGRLITIAQDAFANTPPAQSAALSATSLTFGNQPIASASAPQGFKLTNTGPVALRLSTIAIGGTNARDFAEADACNPILAPAESCTIAVTFTPAAPGTRVASLFIESNLTGGPLQVALSGTATAAAPAPAISAIVDSWGYTPGIAPGLWVTIAGTNLAGPPDATRVTFNGAPAMLLYVSPTQINALVPATVTPGTVDVVVLANGLFSPPFTATARAAHPAVYAPPNADGSTFFVTAALAGTATLIGNSATDPRVLRGAHPGESLDLYMIGLGATLDPAAFITDRLFSGAFPVAAPITASVGGNSATVLFAGLTAPGLYLVRIVVPTDLPPGLQPLQLSAAGIQTRPSLAIYIDNAPQ